MHHNSRWLLIAFLTCFFSIGLPSCSSDYVAFRDIEEIVINDLATGNIYSTPVITSSDSIALRVSLKLNYFTYGEIIPDMMSEAWATSPEEPILANEIVDIRLYCNKPVYGILPGNNLMSELLIGYYYTEKYSITDFLEQLPSKGDRWFENIIYLYFKGKPAPDTYIFNVEIEDNNGHIFSATAPELEWQ